MDSPQIGPASPGPEEDTILCRCSFTLGDLLDIWAEVVDDNEAELPIVMLRRLEPSLGLVEEAMCQRGNEAIRFLLEQLQAGEAS